MTVEILQNIATKYCQICKDRLLKNAVYYDVNYEISCKMIGNTWKVVEMNRQE
jgi:hypothetical protein